MGKNSYSIKLTTAVVALGLMAWACTKKAEFVFPPTKLNIQVFRGENVVSPRTVVGIFSDSNDFNAARWNYNFANADYIDSTDVNGFAKFDSVQSNLKYYVLCKFDSVNSSNDTIAWSNINIDNQFLNPLKSNTVTTAKVVITASDGYVNFWTSNRNTYVTNQPIYIRLAGTVIDSIKATGIQNSVRVKLRAGLYTFSARSAYGCAWIDTVAVKVSQTVNKELEECTMVRVSIGVLSSRSNVAFPMTVVLNNNDTVAVLKASVPTTSVGCGAVNSITVTRPSGTYSYQYIGNDNTTKLGVTKFASPANGINCDTLIVNF